MNDQYYDKILIELFKVISNSSIDIMMMLMDDYKKNVDVELMHTENFAFLVAFLHEQDGIDEYEAKLMIGLLASARASRNRTAKQPIFHSIDIALRFYSLRWFDMNRTKAHTFPDMMVYNLLRPQTYNDFSENIPICEIGASEILKDWAIITDYISNVFISRANEVLKKIP